MEIRSSEAAPGGQGLIQTRTYKWIVPPTGSILPRFQLNFASMSNNITLDTLSVDVRYLPAPGALALVGFAGMLVAKRRRRT
jgi:hypothetical protein